jgi:hypothetical protein
MSLLYEPESQDSLSSCLGHAVLPCPWWTMGLLLQ